MDIAQRSLMVKANLYEEMGTTRSFDRLTLKHAICRSGLSPKSSSIQKVVNYLKHNKHMKEPVTGMYKILYRRKDGAHPKGIPSLMNNNLNQVNEIYHIPKLAKDNISLLTSLIVCAAENNAVRIAGKLQEREECILKFQLV